MSVLYQLMHLRKILSLEHLNLGKNLRKTVEIYFDLRIQRPNGKRYQHLIVVRYIVLVGSDNKKTLIGHYNVLQNLFLAMTENSPFEVTNVSFANDFGYSRNLTSGSVIE